MGYRLKRVTKNGRILYYLEEYSYKKAVQRAMKVATLEDISAHGNLDDILAVLVRQFILPLKFNKDLSEEQAKLLLFSIQELYILAGMDAVSADIQGLDIEETMVENLRKSLNVSLKKAGIESVRAVGVSAKDARTESLIRGLLEWLKIKEGGKVSKIDNRWRLTLPSGYTKRVLGWDKGKKIRVVPYSTGQHGRGFLAVPIVQEKKQDEERIIAMTELCLKVLENFTEELAKHCQISNQELGTAIIQKRDFAQILPRAISQYLESLSIKEIISMHLFK